MDFSKLKVVELASVLAGPSVGMFFAELGADVIKVENPNTGGDVTRGWKSANESKDRKASAYFCSVNYRKKYVQLNLKDKEDLTACYKLIEEADIVISNYLPDVADKLRVSFEHLKEINEQVIFGEIVGYTDSNRGAYDVVLQAETGYMSMNGDPNGLPTKMPLAMIDILAGHQLKQGILVSLATANGKAKKVSVSLEDAAISALTNQATNFLMNNTIPSRIGSLHPNIAPYGEILQSANGRFLVLAIGSDKQFREFCEILNCNEVCEQPDYASNQDRVINRTSLLDNLQEAFFELDFDDVYQACTQKGIPVGEVKNVGQVFDTAEAQSLVREEIIDGEETQRVTEIVFRIS